MDTNHQNNQEEADQRQKEPLQVEAITIFVPRIFPGVVADGLVLEAPFR